VNDNNFQPKDLNTYASPQGDACALSSDNKINNLDERISKAIEGAKLFLISQGQSYYDLGKALVEATEGLDDLQKSRIYKAVGDYLGMSVRTIKNIAYLHKKLSKYILYHTGTNMLRMRLFQIAYYLSKRVSELDKVLDVLYNDITTSNNLRAWLISASYNEIINWAKERFESYIKFYKKGGLVIMKCDVCGGDLHIDDKGKLWDIVAVHFGCYDALKENSNDKIQALRKEIRRVVKEAKIRKLVSENEMLKKRIDELIKELDAIRLKKSRKMKNIQKNIEKAISC